MSDPPGVGVAAVGFLVLTGILLPLAAAAFARSEARHAAGRPAAEASSWSRVPLYVNALATQAVLFGAAILAARVEHVALFASANADLRDVTAAVLTLAAAVGVAEVFWRSRSPAERERLWIRRILPRTRLERGVWVLVSAAAALAEEAAYRGAFVAFATSMTGSLPLAVAASASAFAAVHAPQGPVGVAYVFVLALLHHALVLFTGTLVFAIVVHFAYDVLAGLWVARRYGMG